MQQAQRGSTCWNPATQPLALARRLQAAFSMCLACVAVQASHGKISVKGVSKDEAEHTVGALLLDRSPFTY